MSIFDFYDIRTPDGEGGYLVPKETEPGAYTLIGDTMVTGRCAGCLGQVDNGDAFVVRYHPSKPGGIFHKSCAPAGEGWFDV